MLNTHRGGFHPQVSFANIATVSIDNDEPVFVCVTSIGHNHEVLTSLPPHTTYLSNDTPISSNNNTTDCAHGLSGVYIGRRWTGEDVIIQYTDIDYPSDRLTLIDSGASDYCFVDKFLFTTYKALKQPSVGLSANKGATFSIIEKVNTVTYVRNFILSMRRPGSIPAKLWYGHRQDISYL